LGFILHFIYADTKMGGDLVVMCSSEDENQSYLASALDSYETKILHLRREVKDILKQAFCIKDIINGTGEIYGAVVDEQRLLLDS